MKKPLAFALGLTALLAGCAPLDSDTLKVLSQSDRTWCAVVTTIYGTAKVGGSGIQHGKALCNGEGWSIENNTPASSTIVIQAQPKILIEEKGSLREVDPASLRK